MNKRVVDYESEVANELLATYREKTQDVFMTSFKGLRADGKYRRRLDFKTARAILAKAYELTMGGETL